MELKIEREKEKNENEKGGTMREECWEVGLVKRRAIESQERVGENVNNIEMFDIKRCQLRMNDAVYIAPIRLRQNDQFSDDYGLLHLKESL